MKHFVRTFSGRKVSLTNPSPADIDLRDIAHHLSLINRYNGATVMPMSVAHHSTVVQRIMAANGAGPKQQLRGLLHDAHEAYVGDIVGPMRTLLAAKTKHDIIGEIIEPFDRAIFAAFRLEPPTKHERNEIDRADLMTLRTEWRDLMEGDELYPGEKASFEIRSMQALKAEEKFLKCFQDVMEAIDTEARRATAAGIMM